MHAVIFEVLVTETGYQRYLDLAALLRPRLDTIDGFISIERFRHLRRDGWLLSLSMWRDEAALMQWRGHGEHHAAQAEGRQSVFRDYRIRVAHMDLAQEDGRPLVGLCEWRSADMPDEGALYESLATPGKRLLLRDLAHMQEARTWQAAHDGVLCGAVLRDYGMFERTQAPQSFPAVQRASGESA
jgi:heme-degrading monooxygenase HmoA